MPRPTASWRPLLFVIMLSGIPPLSAASPDAEVRLPAEHREYPEATRAMEKVEATIAELQARPPAERADDIRRLGGDLKRLVERCEGTRLHNKALYLYASWQLEYGELAKVEPLIAKILRSQWPHYRNPAVHLRARLRLRQGRLEAARRDAVEVASKVPAFEPLVELVDYHASVGRPAPKLSSRNLNGGPDDPLGERSEPWLLVLFARLNDADERYPIMRLLEELGDPAYAGRIRPVVVSFDSDPLGAISRVNGVESHGLVDLLWVNPANPVIRDRWYHEWEFPGLPSWVLLGPDRSVLSVEPDINDLRPLVGLDQAESKRVESPRSSPRRGKQRLFDWKGR